MAKKPTKKVLELIRKNRQGIKLDVGCGGNKQKGFVGLDIRKLDTVDIVHDAEQVPYPLPDGCCSTILASHLIEHICPKKFIGVMNEWWRIMKVGGQLWVSCPYGVSRGFQQDPSHCNVITEATWAYFDPELDPSGILYGIYKPMPWKVQDNRWLETGNLEAVLEKIEVKDA